MTFAGLSETGPTSSDAGPTGTAVEASVPPRSFQNLAFFAPSEWLCSSTRTQDEATPRSLWVTMCCEGWGVADLKWAMRIAEEIVICSDVTSGLQNLLHSWSSSAEAAGEAGGPCHLLNFNVLISDGTPVGFVKGVVPTNPGAAD